MIRPCVVPVLLVAFGLAANARAEDAIPTDEPPPAEAAGAKGGAFEPAGVSADRGDADRAEQDGHIHGNDENDPTFQTVVTARRRDQERFEAPRSIEAVGPGRIRELQARAVPELLEDLPGAHVQRTSGGSGIPFIRGLVGPDNLILVDGIRYNNSTFRSGPNQYLGVLHPQAFRRVELVRGPSSVLYGDGAMGGVIHLVTAVEDPDGSPFRIGGNLGGSVSSSDLGRGLDGHLAIGSEKLGMRAGFAYGHHDDIRAGGGEVQPWSGYSVGGASLRLRARPSADLVLDVAYLYSFLLDQGRADDLVKGDLRSYDNHDHLLYAKATWVGRGVVQRVEAAVSWHRTDEDATRFTCDLPSRDPDALARCAALDHSMVDRKRLYFDGVDTIGGYAEAVLSPWRDRLLLTIGMDAYQDFVSSSLRDARAEQDFAWRQAARGNFSDASTYLALGGFLHGEMLIWDFGHKAGRLVASGGPRLSHFRASAPDVPGIGDLSYTATGVVGGASLQWIRTDLYQFYFSFDQGFRAPNLQESTVLGDSGDKFEIPNPDLGPQRSDTYEVGAKVHLDFLDLSLAGFASRLSDLIDEQDATWNGESQVGGKNVKIRVNKQKGLYYGVDTAAALRLWRFTLDGSVTWMKGLIEPDDGPAYAARRIPPLFGRGGLRYDHPDRSFHVEAFVRWAARQDDLHPGDRQDLRICADPANPGKVLSGDTCRGTPGWATLNLAGSVRLPGSASIDLAIYNLLDQRYRTHGSGVMSPGLDVRASVRVAF
jgi:outer membrane receptor protein involved in Fe transport